MSQSDHYTSVFVSVCIMTISHGEIQCKKRNNCLVLSVF